MFVTNFKLRGMCTCMESWGSFLFIESTDYMYMYKIVGIFDTKI